MVSRMSLTLVQQKGARCDAGPRVGTGGLGAGFIGCAGFALIGAGLAG